MGLLEHDLESNILKGFDYEVRRVLVKEVVTFLLNPSTSTNVLSSRSHVLWALETCGEGFRLPVDDEEIIQDVTELYRLWIMDPKRRPPPITKDFQFFFQIMMKHFSLLFKYRSDSVVERHAQLCSTVLNIVLLITKAYAQTLTDETWDVLLKLLIGITDSLFLAPRDPSLLGQKLCNQTLKVLFECWLTAQTLKPEMWGFLKDRVSKWTHISHTIVQWQQVSLALTSRVIRTMYGASHGADAVVIRIDNDTTTLNLPSKYVFYAWHRVLTVLGDLNAIPNPENHLMAFQGVKNFVNEFLCVKANLPENILPPDGNAILHIFGKWLFEAIQIHRKGFDEGTALAVEIVSWIFSDRKDTVFLDTYRASYYRSLQEVLMREGKPLVAAILHSKNLLSKRMNGSRILLPHYVYAITRIVVANVSVRPTDKVRAACIHILGTIFCFPKYFRDAALKLKATTRERQNAVANYHTGSLSPSGTPPSKSVFEAVNYQELLPHINYILLEGLKNETHVPNILSFIQLCFAHSCMYIDTDQDFASSTIQALVYKSRSDWGKGVMFCGFRTVARMSSLFPKLKKGTELAKLVVSDFCKFAIKMCQELYRVREGLADKQRVRLTVQAFLTIADWITVDQWIVGSTKALDQVLDAISVGIFGPKQKQEVASDSKKGKKDKEKKKEKKGEEQEVVIEPSNKVAGAARFLLRSLLNRMGVFPALGAGSASVSTLVSEEELLNDNVKKAEELGIEIADKKQFMRSFILQGNTIASVVDQPYEEGGPRCTLFVRDGSGRYCWQCNSAFLSFKERGVESKTMEHCRQPVEILKNPHHSSAQPVPEEQLSSITKYLSEKKWPYDVNALAVEMEEREQNYLKSADYNLAANITVQPPSAADPYVPLTKFQQGRLLLTHLGLLTFDNWGHIFPLEQTTNFFSQIKLLDQVPERESISVSVVYMQKGQSYQEAMSNSGGSLDYQEFVSSLGWGIHIPTHTGFLGGLERSPPTHGTFAPYYSDYSTEVIFHCGTLMPNNAQQVDQNHKHRLIGSNTIAIVWTEDPIEDYTPNFGKLNKLHIVIHPVFKRGTYNLYQIKIFLKGPLTSKFWTPEFESFDIIGPAMDEMIVCKDKLGSLVRDTAILTWGWIQESNTGKESFKHIEQFMTRERVISDIEKKFRQLESFELFHANIFAPLPSKYVMPLKSHVPGRSERAHQRSLCASAPTPVFSSSSASSSSSSSHQTSPSPTSPSALSPVTSPPNSPNLCLPSSPSHSPSTSPSPSSRSRSVSTDERDEANEALSPQEEKGKQKKKSKSKSVKHVGERPGGDDDDDKGKEREKRDKKLSSSESTWAAADGRVKPERPAQPASPNPKEQGSGSKFQMSSQRMGGTTEGKDGKEEGESAAKPPRPPPPKVNLEQLEDLESYNF